MRSFWLNFEATLFVYNREFTEKLRSVQRQYEMESRTLVYEQFRKRPIIKRFKENISLLIGPLL